MMDDAMRTNSADPGRPLLVFVHGSAELYGSDKVLLNLVTALSSGADFQPVVLLHQEGPLRALLQREGVETHVGCVVKIQRSMFKPQVAWVLLRALRQAEIDLDLVVGNRRVAAVYSNTLAVLGGAYWAWRKGHKHLWHVHEIIRRPAVVRRVLPMLAERLSHRVVSNSVQTERWLLEQSPRLRNRSAVIVNGLPPVAQVSGSDRNAFRASLGLSSQDVLVTLVGRLNHWKGQDLFVQALALLKDRGQIGVLRAAIVGDVFAGQDSVRLGLLERIERAGLERYVYLVPFRADVYTVWWSSDIAVVPSIEPEPFGLVAIEAMACGVPVIAAAHGGLLDIVQHEITGLFFAPCDAEALANALRRLASDASLRRALGATGQARQAAHFSLKSQVERTRKLCLEMAAT